MMHCWAAWPAPSSAADAKNQLLLRHKKRNAPKWQIPRKSNQNITLKVREGLFLFSLYIHVLMYGSTTLAEMLSSQSSHPLGN